MSTFVETLQAAFDYTLMDKLVKRKLIGGFPQIALTSTETPIPLFLKWKVGSFMSVWFYNRQGMVKLN